MMRPNLTKKVPCQAPLYCYNYQGSRFRFIFRWNGKLFPALCPSWIYCLPSVMCGHSFSESMLVCPLSTWWL